jgi:hypothetical protein
MADIASELAKACGISAESAQKALGVILGLLKSKLPAESFTRLSSAIPGADGMMEAAADLGQEGTGILEAVKGAFGKILGSGTEATLARFAQLGLSPDQIQAFIPKVLEFLKGKLPENVMTQIKGHLPTPQETAH